MINNRIITKGFGPTRGVVGRSGPITLGYGGIPKFVEEALTQEAVRRLHGGRPKPLDQIDEIVVWAKLVSVNGERTTKNISGSVVVKKNTGNVRTIVEHISSAINRQLHGISIFVNMIRKK